MSYSAPTPEQTAINEKEIAKQEAFKQELTDLINRYSKESYSNTPDFILAEYLIDCLSDFEFAVKARENWFSRESKVTRKGKK